jgi:CheY-like chemotaxis protein
VGVLAGKAATNVSEGRAIYAAAAVERMVGASAETIHSWEQRYGIAAPTRSPGGQMLYSRDEVERLRWIARELAAGREPAAVPAGQNSTSSSDGAAPAPHLLVLLAERDPRAADLAEFFLRTEGYRVEVSFTAQEAVAQAAVARPDVSIVELSVSGHSGFHLCQSLRALTDAPIIAVSSLDRRDEALAMGVDAFLLKPLDPLVLVSTVKDLLGASAFLRPDSER